MIHFFLNIEKFYESEFENGSEIQAIACIEYPIIHVIAKTIETTEEEYDNLDKFIVQTAYTHERFGIQEFSALTGIGKGVFDFRAIELVKQEYVTYSNEVIMPIEKGIDFINDNDFEREIEKTRSFILDGVTHKPLHSYFYREGKENLISEEERDSYGKVFNPSIIHNPPTKSLAESILSIPVEERLQYGIPTHLKRIKDYDFILMTYPLLIVLSKTSAGQTTKRIVDGFTKTANADDIAAWQKNLNQEISKTEIVIEEVGSKNGKQGTPYFRNNWSNNRTAAEGRIFSVSKHKLGYFIKKLFKLTEIDEKNIVQNEQELKVGITRQTFEVLGADRQKMLEACVRGRDYCRQREWTGSWLVFFKIYAADDYIKGLVDLYKLLHKEILIPDLLTHYQNDYKILRHNLIAIERFDKLEELDIYLFLYLRESSGRKYLTLKND